MLEKLVKDNPTLESRLDPLEEKLKMIDKVSVSDIKKVAEDIFKDEKLNLAIIGPVGAKEKQRLEKLLKL